MMSSRGVIAAALVAALVPSPAPARAPAGKPKPDIEFSLAGRTFTEKDKVRMYGDVDPATISEVVVLHTQRYDKKAEDWEHYDKRRVDSDSEGSYSYRHRPFPKGNYRTRAEVQETDDHLDGKTRWKTMAVRRRNF